MQKVVFIIISLDWIWASGQGIWAGGSQNAPTDYLQGFPCKWSASMCSYLFPVESHQAAHA